MSRQEGTIITRYDRAEQKSMARCVSNLEADGLYDQIGFEKQQESEATHTDTGSSKPHPDAWECRYVIG